MIIPCQTDPSILRLLLENGSIADFFKPHWRFNFHKHMACLLPLACLDSEDLVNELFIQAWTLKRPQSFAFSQGQFQIDSLLINHVRLCLGYYGLIKSPAWCPFPTNSEWNLCKVWCDQPIWMLYGLRVSVSQILQHFPNTAITLACKWETEAWKKRPVER